MEERSFSPSSNSTPFFQTFSRHLSICLQKDKCHSNFEKYLNVQVYMSFFTTYPYWEQSLVLSVKSMHRFNTYFRAYYADFTT